MASRGKGSDHGTGAEKPQSGVVGMAFMSVSNFKCRVSEAHVCLQQDADLGSASKGGILSQEWFARLDCKRRKETSTRMRVAKEKI